MKGYRTERKVKMTFEQHGWKVVRAGASFGIADLVCIKNGKCLLLQVKSTKNRTLYYYGPMEKKVEGFPFYLIVDFGYGRTRVIHPKKRIGMNDGTDLEEFLRRGPFC